MLHLCAERFRLSSRRGIGQRSAEEKADGNGEKRILRLGSQDPDYCYGEMTRQIRGYSNRFCGAFVLVLGALAGLVLAAPSDSEQEAFLLRGKVISVRAIDHGVTKPRRTTLAYGKLRHDAQIQTVDLTLPFFIRDNMRIPNHDRWKYNVAAYRIDRLISLNMIPVTVARSYSGKPAAFTWWADDIMMEEVERRKKDLQAPDREAFQRQVDSSKVFDELIINFDRNLANLLITKDWQLVLIDHTRAFTAYPNIRNTDNLTRCSRKLLASMKTLTAERVRQSVKDMLSEDEIGAVIKRRDKIVAYFEKLAAEKGAAVVYFP